MMDRKEHYKKNREKLIERSRQWRRNNPEKRKQIYANYYEKHKILRMEQSREYYQKHKERLLKYAKKYREEHKKEHNIYINNKNKTDLKFNLNCKIRAFIGKSIRENKFGRHWETLVGYTLNDLIKRLQETMPKGYDWEDVLNAKLHIDHIIPINVFNYSKPEHTDFKRCWALSNLQLLPARDNLIKHNKLTKPFQPALAI